MMKQLACSLVALGALVAACAGQSQTPNPTNPTVITAKTLSFDYKRSIAVMEGDVVVVDPQMTVKSDKLNVIFDSTNSVKAIVATGNVRMWAGDKTATCHRAVYSAKTAEVVLTGDATLKREKDTVSGDTITFHLNSDTMTCTPGTLRIFPQEGKRTTPDLRLKR
jgi:lipopolysaccharide transport protein LptA